jgi:hypothetical protein
MQTVKVKLIIVQNQKQFSLYFVKYVPYLRIFQIFVVN